MEEETEPQTYKKSVASQCFEDEEIRVCILNKIAQTAHAEIKVMCSSKVHSVLQQHSNEAFKIIQLGDIFMAEIKENAPVLYHIMLACTKTKQPRSNRKGVIGMCLAMLLKFRYNHMDVIHKVIAMIMYAGHCGKQVLIYLILLNN